MDAHLRKGLVIGVFPEGKMSGTPEEIASFRRGTFAQAISAPCQSQSHFQAPLTAGQEGQDRWLVHDPGASIACRRAAQRRHPMPRQDSRRSAAGRCKRRSMR